MQTKLRRPLLSAPGRLPNIKRRRLTLKLVILSVVLAACAFLFYLNYIHVGEKAPAFAPGTPGENSMGGNSEGGNSAAAGNPAEGNNPSDTGNLANGNTTDTGGNATDPTNAPADAGNNPAAAGGAGESAPPESKPGGRPIGELEGVFVKDGRKIAYLTFDDGPSPGGSTEKILAILRDEGILATFFMPGYMAEASPDLVRRVYAEGHMVSNHSYSHKYDKIYASRESFISEVEKTDEILKNIIGGDYENTLFRFPGGSAGGKYDEVKNEYRGLLAERGYRYIDWNALTGDSDGKKRTPSQLYDYFVKTAQGKEKLVVLMHDAPPGNGASEALPRVIKYLKDNGYEFSRLCDVGAARGDFKK